jgi:hypothetical protein
MKITLLTLFGAISFLCAQTTAPLNFDFERKLASDPLPEQVGVWGDYTIASDAQIFYSGAQSIRISSGDKINSFGAFYIKIPARFKGKTIRLEGFIKTENVVGDASLLLRMNRDKVSLKYYNQSYLKYQGTNDWKAFTIRQEYLPETNAIFVGGILNGSGTVWFDQLKVTLDGQPIDQVTLRELTSIEKDTEFDSESKFQLENPTAQQLKNLEILGKVWGFVKYHHPKVASGIVHWDYELFRMLPLINETNFTSLLVQKINDLGSYSTINKKLPDANIIKTVPQVAWIRDTALLGDSLSATLVQLHQAKVKANYFVSQYPRVGNPKFDNELSYMTMDWNDTGYKLLALFRYWNVVNYFSPNRHLVDQPWETVLPEFIPKVLQTTDELKYKLLMVELIGKLQDSHANVWGYEEVLHTYRGENAAQVKLQYVQNQFVVVKSHQKEPMLQVGDVITKVNGVPVADWVAQKENEYPGSNVPTQFRDRCRDLLRTNLKSLPVTVERNGILVDLTVPTEATFYYEDTTPASKMLPNDIGYLYPGTLKRGEIDAIMESFLEKRGIVIDFRCYPSDFILFKLGNYLYPKRVDFAKFSGGSIEQPGLFVYRKGTPVGKSNSKAYKGKVVVLVNDETQSSAEYHCMALRAAPHVTIIGSTTAGADGNVSKLYLPGGVLTMISGIGVYYPDGTETQRIGIVPDVECKPTIQGVREGRDELLEKAIEIILKS